MDKVKPADELLNERINAHHSTFTRKITVETTDPILFAICNLDRYGEQSELFSVEQRNVDEELLKAKLQQCYPPEDKEILGIRIKYLESAARFKARCLC